MIRTFQRYWYDIRRTLIFYSLIPAFLFLLIAYPLLYASFTYTLYDNNTKYNTNISRVLEAELEKYKEMADQFAVSEEIKQVIEESSKLNMVGIYENIYACLGEHKIRAKFYAIDTEGNILLSTNKLVPEYLEEGKLSYNGIIKRMKGNPTEVFLERYLSVEDRIPSMCIGRAVEIGNEVKGYVLLDISGAKLLEPLERSSFFGSAITDRFGHPFTGTMTEAMYARDKISKVLREGKSIVTVDGRSMHVARKELLEGDVWVYTVTDMGYTEAMFSRIGVLLLILAVLITGLLLFTSQRFARRKSKVLDDMVSAIRNIQNGDLTTRLEVASHDEFQLFAEEYNRMLMKLEDLMRINEEITRHTVITEIKQLESQFNPHFLYNTLNTIKYMVDLDPKGAQEMITDLSEILRYSIKNTSSQVRLEEDLQYTKNYLAILKYRFGDMLKCSLKIAPEVTECMVPKLIIQPVIENAINYGFASNASLSIDISAEIQDGELVLVIRNDGTGMTPERLAEVRNQLENEHHMLKKHIGLYNIHRRIQLLYGMTYGVKIDSSPDKGTTVTMQLPGQRGKTND